MPEIQPELSGTRLSDRELLIHAIQHLEDLTEQLAETRAAVLRVDGELTVFLPLLRKLAPGGKVDMISIMQTRREARRGREIS